MYCCALLSQQKAQLQTRRNAEPTQLIAFQPSLNRPPANAVNLPQIGQLLQTPARNQFVYCIQGGKGADLARNKNIPLSYLMDNPNGVIIQQDAWSSHEVRLDKTIRAIHTTGPIRMVAPTPLTYQPDVLQQFLMEHADEVGRSSTNRYRRSLKYLFKMTNREQVAQLFLGNNPDLALNDPKFQQDLDIFFNARDEWLERYNGDMQALVDDLKDELLFEILYSNVPETITKYNSSPAAVSRFAS